MQSKDIPERPILEFLLENKEPSSSNQFTGWATAFGREYENSIQRAMPEWVNSKLVLAKMRSLIKRKLVDGCACGCRGDFVITEKGIKEISNTAPAEP